MRNLNWNMMLVITLLHIFVKDAFILYVLRLILGVGTIIVNFKLMYPTIESLLETSDKDAVRISSKGFSMASLIFILSLDILDERMLWAVPLCVGTYIVDVILSWDEDDFQKILQWNTKRWKKL